MPFTESAPGCRQRSACSSIPCPSTLGKEEFRGTGKVVVWPVTLTPEQKLTKPSTLVQLVVTYVLYFLIARFNVSFLSKFTASIFFRVRFPSVFHIIRVYNNAR
jgi:hypothetical protein